MAFKRKRSIDASASPFSSSSHPTPEAQSPAPTPQNTMDTDFAFQFQRPTGWNFGSVSRVKSNSGGSDWGMRTCKRVRDNRPDEGAIHENTINKLFTAQRIHPHATPIMSDTLSSQPSSSTAPAVQKPQKSTLHAFWNISAPPVQAPVCAQEERPSVLTCEDCDAALEVEGDGMDVDMEGGRSVERSVFACHDCGRCVCGWCAVVAETRHCLQCATSARNSRRW